MKLTVSSDVSADQEILRALTQPEPTPFHDLIATAQKTLDRLSKSLFFRRFIEEKLVEVRLTKVLRIARSSQSPNAEWLVITPEFKILFMRHEGSDDVLYTYEDRDHDEFLIKKAGPRLEQMSMYYLITRFGKPSFTLEEVQAEITRNGKMTIFSVRDGDSGLRELNAERTLRHLQFDVSVVELDFHEKIPEVTEGNFIIILDIDPESAPHANAFYKELSAEQRRHLWTTKVNEDADNLYRRAGIDMPIIMFPGVIYCLNLPQEELLQMLDNMFRAPE